MLRAMEMKHWLPEAKAELLLSRVVWMFDPAGIGFAPREHRQFPVRTDFSKHRMNEENVMRMPGSNNHRWQFRVSHRIEEESVVHMLDWNTYRQQLVAGVGGFGKLNPDIIKGYTTLSRAGQKAGHLDEKTRELIALAVAITLRCDGCITVHTAAARERGATREEIAEVLGVAVSVNAGAAVVYSTRALDAFDAAAEINPNA
jgi:AhpD family alkylhydroperoxidase